MNRQSLGAIRKEFVKDELNKENVDPNPIVQFEHWFKEAYAKEGDDANATTLSTMGSDGHPEGRIVLLKFYSDDGYTFYTNYNSNKAMELEKHPYASMTFFWRTLERQVRIRGKISKVDPIISDEYFASRPRTSQIGAWASPQSEELPDREALKALEKKYLDQFEGHDHIPRPEHWGGYLIDPTRIEFWQGRPSRLHDRIVYVKEEGQWVTKRLAP